MNELDEIAIRRCDELATLLFLRRTAIKDFYRAQPEEWQQSEQGRAYRRWLDIIDDTILKLGQLSRKPPTGMRPIVAVCHDWDAEA